MSPDPRFIVLRLILYVGIESMEIILEVIDFIRKNLEKILKNPYEFLFVFLIGIVIGFYVRRSKDDREINTKIQSLEEKIESQSVENLERQRKLDFLNRASEIIPRFHAAGAPGWFGDFLTKQPEYPELKPLLKKGYSAGGRIGRTLSLGGGSPVEQQFIEELAAIREAWGFSHTW
jgi:hypothetical protein